MTPRITGFTGSSNTVESLWMNCNEIKIIHSWKFWSVLTWAWTQPRSSTIACCYSQHLVHIPDSLSQTAHHRASAVYPHTLDKPIGSISRSTCCSVPDRISLHQARGAAHPPSFILHRPPHTLPAPTCTHTHPTFINEEKEGRKHGRDMCICAYSMCIDGAANWNRLH